ncbi:MAG: DUF6788 family protein [Nitrospiraceae bacterium]
MSLSRKAPPTSLDTKLQRLEERHRALLREFVEIGPVLRGSICTRRSRCGKSACRCHHDPDALHGPYPIWTRKVAGKTVTVTLSAEQVARFRTKNMRRLDQVVKTLQDTGLRAADAVLSAK